MAKPIVFSGMQPTGSLHLGNYLGALKNWVDLQNSGRYEMFVMVADLHSLTIPMQPKVRREQIKLLAAEYLAAGIDPNKTVFFLQSEVLEHAALAWIFNCITPLGELYRMTQYKDKSKQHKENINAGLLVYPTLMAADILLYKPTAIPVGEDQVQHVELARAVARKFNKKFGKTFPEPKTYLTKPLRVMSLTDPEKKMSKTGDPDTSNGTGRSEALLLDDSPAEITRKLKKAVTASGAGHKSAGVENLFLLLKNFGTKEENAFFRSAQQGQSLKFSELKETLAKEIALYFEGFREKKKELLARPEQLAEVLGEGSKKAREVAAATLNEVKEKLGLL